MEKTNIIITTVAVIILVVLVGLGIYLYSPANGTALVPPTEPSAPEAKINIDAVCDGALAYMKFADEASASVFVADCKEGKHPEVIEHYKASLNVGAGVAI